MARSGASFGSWRKSSIASRNTRPPPISRISTVERTRGSSPSTTTAARSRLGPSYTPAGQPAIGSARRPSSTAVGRPVDNTQRNGGSASRLRAELLRHRARCFSTHARASSALGVSL
ncbi:hypothetical protein BE21_40625 [Sorangium cellulosum]|uniref:Uncharacterized protein n=1 Tax=Sorangium cellulosum TaxID=56 RepID=A0A150TL60_SORCE|nr:hypothetical protein BE21_40625 [Sorangium cellulosum]